MTESKKDGSLMKIATIIGTAAITSFVTYHYSQRKFMRALKEVTDELLGDVQKFTAEGYRR